MTWKGGKGAGGFGPPRGGGGGGSLRPWQDCQHAMIFAEGRGLFQESVLSVLLLLNSDDWWLPPDERHEARAPVALPQTEEG